MNLYGFAGGDPVNFSDPLGLMQDSTKKKAAAPTSGAQDASGASGPQPETPFGVGLTPMQVTRGVIGYGGFAVSLNDLQPAGEYRWDVPVEGEPNAQGSLRLQLRNTRPAELVGTEYVYSGELQFKGKVYQAQMNMIKVGPAVYAHVKAWPY